MVPDANSANFAVGKCDPLGISKEQDLLHLLSTNLLHEADTI